MEKLVVYGGNNLYGSLRIPAAKNSLLPLLAAAAIVDGSSVFFNCPDLSDISGAMQILEHVGAKTSRKAGAITVNAGAIACSHIPQRLMAAMRGSLMFLGALLTATGEAKAYMPGGCRIGSRPIDIHLDVFRALGAKVSTEGGFIDISAPSGLRGAQIRLRFCSVGATENAILAAVKARGATEIFNAAREPEISDLIGYLNRCGARIKGRGTSHIYIEGVTRLCGVDYMPISDRIMAATGIAAAAIAGGQLFLEGARYEDMGAFVSVCRDMGVNILAARDGMTVYRRPNSPIFASPYPIVTSPFPGFPTDCAPLVAAMLCCAEGCGEIRETIFENRFDYCTGFSRLGARVSVEGTVAHIEKAAKLNGNEVSATDLRGGAALVCLSLAVKERTIINELKYIDRGYDHIERSLSAIGANIQRVKI